MFRDDRLVSSGTSTMSIGASDAPPMDFSVEELVLGSCDRMASHLVRNEATGRRWPANCFGP